MTSNRSLSDKKGKGVRIKEVRVNYNTGTSEGRLKAVHPGAILKEELECREISQSQVSRDLNVSFPTINEICNEKRSLTADMAVRLERYLDVSAEFWLNIQKSYDIEIAMEKIGEDLDNIRPSKVA